MLACFALACQTVLCKGNTFPSAHGQNPLRRDAPACKAQIPGQEQPRHPSFPENVLHGNAGEECLKLWSSLCAGAVNQLPRQPPAEAGAGPACPPFTGRAGHKKAGIALEVAVACREALLKHFMPVFRWYENSFLALNPPTSFPAGGKGLGTMKPLLHYPCPKGGHCSSDQCSWLNVGPASPHSWDGCVAPSHSSLCSRSCTR